MKHNLASITIAITKKSGDIEIQPGLRTVDLCIDASRSSQRLGRWMLVTAGCLNEWVKEEPQIGALNTHKTFSADDLAEAGRRDALV